MNQNEWINKNIARERCLEQNLWIFRKEIGRACQMEDAMATLDMLIKVSLHKNITFHNLQALSQIWINF